MKATFLFYGSFIFSCVSHTYSLNIDEDDQVYKHKLEGSDSTFHMIKVSGDENKPRREIFLDYNKKVNENYFIHTDKSSNCENSNPEDRYYKNRDLYDLERLRKEMTLHEHDIRHAVSDASGIFEWYIKAYSEPYPHDVWVAFLADKKYTKGELTSDWLQRHAEMAMTVSASSQVPYSSHMGILRNYGYLGTQNKRISGQLHAFSAGAVLKEYGDDKIYMANNPLPGHQSYLNGLVGCEELSKIEKYPGRMQRRDGHMIEISPDQVEVHDEYNSVVYSGADVFGKEITFILSLKKLASMLK